MPHTKPQSMLRCFQLNRPAIAITGALLLATSVGRVHAQSADALINKLVEKGILTTEEAQSLRKEVDQDFSKAFSSKFGKQKWVESFKLGGDLRLRYEGFHSSNPTAVDRNRFQYRLRYGFTADLLDDFQIGLRVNSIGDTAGNPISSNQTFDNNASKKGLALDQLYVKWNPVDNDTWATTFIGGKMGNPFEFSPIVFDPDYTPDGLAQQFVFHVHPKHDVGLNFGGFVLEEQPLTYRDSYLLARKSGWNPSGATAGPAP